MAQFDAIHNDPITIARSFQNEIADRAAEIEEARRFPDDLARRLATTGLHQLCTPTTKGGCGRSPYFYAAAVEELAKADASAGWCVFIGITSSLAVSRLDDQPLEKIFAARDTICAGVFAPMGRAVSASESGVEGYRVSGRWQWGSGIQNSDWVGVGGIVLNEAGKPLCSGDGVPIHHSFVVSRDNVELIDTWHVAGLQGTGSTDFQLTDVFVPANQVYRTSEPVGLTAPIYSFPTFGFLGIGIAAVALGAAQAALDDVLALVHNKIPQGGRKPLSHRPSTHKCIAEAHGHIQASRLFFYQTIDDAWQAAERGETLSVKHRRDIRHATTFAVNSAVTAVDSLYRLAGGSSVYKTFALQRRFRDIHVATQHMMVSDSVLELVGRLIVGIDTDVAQL